MPCTILLPDLLRWATLAHPPGGAAVLALGLISSPASVSTGSSATA